MPKFTRLLGHAIDVRSVAPDGDAGQQWDLVFTDMQVGDQTVIRVGEEVRDAVVEALTRSPDTDGVAPFGRLRVARPGIIVPTPRDPRGTG